MKPCHFRRVQKTLSSKKKALDRGVQLRSTQAILADGVLSLARRRRLQKLFSTFPAGLPGIGLILLRIAVALWAIIYGFIALTSRGGPTLMLWPIGSLAIIAGLALLTGFLTPLAGAAAAFGYVTVGISQLLATDAAGHGNAFATLDLAVMSAALVLLGPGAISLDARLFGRREIIIPEGRRSPRS